MDPLTDAREAPRTRTSGAGDRCRAGLHDVYTCLCKRRSRSRTRVAAAAAVAAVADNQSVPSLSLSLPHRPVSADMIVSPSLSQSHSLTQSLSLSVHLRVRSRDQTRRFSETAGIKDRGAMGPVCRRPLSRVTRVGTVDLSLPKNRYKDIGTVHSILHGISLERASGDITINELSLGQIMSDKRDRFVRVYG